ncbi:GNAT family N-acetyltransferase [Paenibacillus tarimensis]
MKVRPLSITDFECVLSWSKDEVFCTSNGWRKRSDEEIRQWWVQCVNNVSDNYIRKGIEYRGRFIGYADLANIKDNTAEFGIAIGESALWGKGLGFFAGKSIIEYASSKDIQVLYAETHETNNRSRNLLGNLGFIEISRNGSEKYLGTETQLIQYKLSL